MSTTLCSPKIGNEYNMGKTGFDAESIITRHDDDKL